jgi:hypothetical protein
MYIKIINSQGTSMLCVCKGISEFVSSSFPPGQMLVSHDMHYAASEGILFTSRY